MKLKQADILAILNTNRYLIANSTIEKVPADIKTEMLLLKDKITKAMPSKRPGCEVEIVKDKDKKRIPYEIFYVKLKRKHNGVGCRPVIRKITYIERGSGNKFFQNIYYIKEKNFVIAYEAYYDEQKRATC